jgi:hypothetical protein
LGLGHKSPVTKAPGLAPRISPAFSRKPRCVTPGASAEAEMARPSLVNASSLSLASRQVQQAARSSRVVNASGSASSATLSPPTVISRMAKARLPSAASQLFKTG